MYPKKDLNEDMTSTPKRRRLGVSKFFLSTQRSQSFRKSYSRSRPSSPCLTNDDEPLPCNQMEFLRVSRNSTSGIVDNSILKKVEMWESLGVSRYTNKSLLRPSFLKKVHRPSTIKLTKKMSEHEDISHKLFEELEPESSYFVSNTSSTNAKGGELRENAEENFEIVNNSTCNNSNDNNKSALLESKDMDIKEGDADIETKKKKSNTYNVLKPEMIESSEATNETFYGLPMITKDLFKSIRNIEKLYDWQNECLNLPAITERRNLIYALPTSGGKTLVAEILMLREVLCRKKNALFILPFVAIVQEKMSSLAPFAVQLDFLLEEYAGGKGHMPPKKRRKKNTIYIATIEKGLALVRSLIELDRLSELGLVVVDELHLIGEEGRGGTLEALLSTILFTKRDIQIIGMSATIGNLMDLASYLHADVFTKEFRPVDLTEYVKLDNVLYRLMWNNNELQLLRHRELLFDYTEAGLSLDPDYLGGLVSEVVPEAACLVFCPTKRNCENVAKLLCKVQRKEMTLHRTLDRTALSSALFAEGASSSLVHSALYGVAYHHAGLANEERSMIENAFRNGVISVLCCTSTLAAGVNLPAARVIIRAPLVGTHPITLAAYKQMAGRAGRAGKAVTGESIIICSDREWPQLESVLSSGVLPAKSVLIASGAIKGLVLSAVALKLATTRAEIRQLLECTLMATEVEKDEKINVKAVCDDCLSSLLKSNALDAKGDNVKTTADSESSTTDYLRIYSDTEFTVSKIGMASIKGCMDLTTTKHLLSDLEVASRNLVLLGSLHLLYLVTPHDAAGVKPDCRQFYSLYCSLDDEGVHTARILGITESSVIRIVTDKPNVPERVLRRFYLAMMLHDLWKQVPFAEVADKYCVSRGTLQSVMASTSSFAWSAHKACEQLDHLWHFAALLGELATRLQHCATPELKDLMELPAVQKGRAIQLQKAGYKRIEDVAKASADDLVSAISNLHWSTATNIISSARMMLIEKVENLRAEAEDFLEELNA